LGDIIVSCAAGIVSNLLEGNVELGVRLKAAEQAANESQVEVGLPHSASNSHDKLVYGIMLGQLSLLRYQRATLEGVGQGCLWRDPASDTM
jgi:hypothetical protein